jgi:LysR family transcriptional regulator, low CO2-responsive transcriptional regulator
MFGIDQVYGMPMTIGLLRAFHLVAEAKGFTAAAREAGLSQPTLSAQVKRLEARHGVSLFNRRGRKLELTPMGQGLFQITTRLFAAHAEAEALLAGAETLRRGHLRIAADSATHVMPLLAQLKRHHGQVTFSLRIDNSADVLARVLDHDADIGVAARRSPDPRLFSQALRQDHLVVFVPKSHAWARRKRITVGEIGGRDLVIREPGSVTRETFEARLAEAGVKPAALIEVQSREAVREAVLAGFGLGVVFHSERGSDPTIHTLEVDGVDLAVAEYVICLDEHRRLPLVRAFLAAVRDAEQAS